MKQQLSYDAGKLNRHIGRLLRQLYANPFAAADALGVDYKVMRRLWFDESARGPSLDLLLRVQKDLGCTLDHLVHTSGATGR